MPGLQKRESSPPPSYHSKPIELEASEVRSGTSEVPPYCYQMSVTIHDFNPHRESALDSVPVKAQEESVVHVGQGHSVRKDLLLRADEVVEALKHVKCDLYKQVGSDSKRKPKKEGGRRLRRIVSYPKKVLGL